MLADEINRGTPKTQSALLEVMAEGKVTVDGVPHAVPRPFLVVATQNPIELDGTYRLPEAQLDRFLMRLRSATRTTTPRCGSSCGDTAGVDPDRLQPVLDVTALEQIIAQVRQLHVDPQIASYAVRLAAATRDHPAIRYGASPRGSVALVRAARAWPRPKDAPTSRRTTQGRRARRAGAPADPHPRGRAESPVHRGRPAGGPGVDLGADRCGRLRCVRTRRGVAVLGCAVTLLRAREPSWACRCCAAWRVVRSAQCS